MTRPESASLANNPGLKSLRKNVDILTTPLMSPITPEDLDAYTASIFPKSKRRSIFGAKMTGWELKRLARGKLYGSTFANIPQMAAYYLYATHLSWLGDIGFSLSHNLSQAEYYKLERRSKKYEKRLQKDPIIQASLAEDPAQYINYPGEQVPKNLAGLVGEVRKGKISHEEALTQLRSARTSLYKSGVGELLTMHAKIGWLTDAAEHIEGMGESITYGDRNVKGLRKIQLLPVPKDEAQTSMTNSPYPDSINLPIFFFGRRAIRLDGALARLEADVVMDQYVLVVSRSNAFSTNTEILKLSERIATYAEPLRQDIRRRR